MGIRMGMQNNSLLVRPEWFHSTINILLDEHCKRPYSKVKDVELVLRVSEQREFGDEGLQRPRLMRSKGYFSVDLIIDQRSWLERTPLQSRDQLIILIRQALDTYVSRLEKNNIEVAKEKLFGDFERFQAGFERLAVPDADTPPPDQEERRLSSPDMSIFAV